MASTTDLALNPPYIDYSPGPEYAENNRLWQGIPAIERAANGRLWAAWYSGGEDEGAGNFVLLVTSNDDGNTWSSPILAIAPKIPLRAFDPALWHDPQGRLWLFWAQSHGLFDGRVGVWAMHTSDSGSDCPEWSAPVRICNGIMMNKPTVLSTGEWLLPAAVWSSLKGVHFYLPGELGSRVISSTDNGSTWRVRGKADIPDVTFDEHMIIEKLDGSFWMLVRTSYGIGESFSTDRGITWSPGQPSKIPHVDSRFHIRRLSSGELLLIRHNPPDGTSRSHLTIYHSNDDGATWIEDRMLDERLGVSYPDAIESPDGTVYIIYDYRRQGSGQILMQKHNDPKIHIVSKLAKQ